MCSVALTLAEAPAGVPAVTTSEYAPRAANARLILPFQVRTERPALRFATVNVATTFLGSSGISVGEGAGRV